jgi:phage-related protein
MDFLLPFLEVLVAGISDLTRIITDALGPAFEFIQGLFDSIQGAFSGTGESASEFGVLVEEVWATVEELFVAAQMVVEEVLEIISTLWEVHGERILRFIEIIWGNIKTQIEAALQVIKGIIQIVTGLISGDWGRVWDGIRAVFGGVWDGIVGAIGTAIELIKETIGGALDHIELIWETAWTNMRDLFEGIWDGIVGTLRSIGNSLLGLLESLINGALRGLQSAINVADVLAGPFINFPDAVFRRITIPRLAEGGSVVAPGLVQVHQDELLSLPVGASVIPLDRAGGGRPWIVTLNLDGRTIARATGPHLVDELILHSGARRSEA